MKDRTLVLMWDNFGPLHHDRLAAVVRHMGAERQIVGLELCGTSDTYRWDGAGVPAGCRHVTLFPGRALTQLRTDELARALLRFAHNERRKTGTRPDFLLCHYDVLGVFLAALVLRLEGHRIWTMGCSKFDDKPRTALREALKSVFLRPYIGALGSGRRSRDYFRYLGLPEPTILGEYNTVSLDRIRAQAGLGPFAQAYTAEGPAFAERDFVCVSRLVPKKNLALLLRAYALYHGAAVPAPRTLHLLGDGPEEPHLRALADQLGLGPSVRFHGFVQSQQVSQHLRAGLALLLPSIEEQFGNVVPEAQALGLPVIVSDNAGARDHLVRSGQNGFVIEPDNAEGLAWMMGQLASDEALWQRLRAGAFATAPRGDVARFAEGVGGLLAQQEGKA